MLSSLEDTITAETLLSLMLVWMSHGAFLDITVTHRNHVAFQSATTLTCTYTPLFLLQLLLHCSPLAFVFAA